MGIILSSRQHVTVLILKLPDSLLCNFIDLEDARNELAQFSAISEDDAIAFFIRNE